MARSVVGVDRQAVVAETLQLTESEAGAFWPLYHRYRAEMDKVGDGLLKLVEEYAGFYPNVPDHRAKELLKDLGDLEKRQAAARSAHLKKISKAVPASKALRFAQVENRLDLALRLKLAAQIPLVPIEGRMTGTVTAGAVYAEGVPGGVAVQTVEFTATVAAINRVGREVTLVSAEGIKQTVKAGQEVINFDQIRLGDQLRVTATEELVVQMAGPGESADDTAAGLVALAPKGARPGGLLAESTQVAARVAAIDPRKHTATLQFEDGSTKTLAVRGDVDLSRHKVGEKVLFRVTEMIALRVDKP